MKQKTGGESFSFSQFKHYELIKNNLEPVPIFAEQSLVTGNLNS